ncbi:MAG: RHS repeat-associated core domain-containing protein [Xanthomonadales bacterium]|nr:RHS repeat-associated core domain-containing protein [Xanthomonadales bacterium]
MTSGDRSQSNQYLYSAHGDLLKEIKDQNGVLTTTRFAYDAEHHLISARVIRGVDQGSNANTPDTIAPNETLLQYRYDPDGVLIGEDRITTASTTGTGGTTGISVPGLQSTDYAIDRSGAYAQIIEERDGQSGKLITSHTWGLTHLSETRTQSRNVQCGTTQDRTNCNSTEIDQIANPHTSWLLQDHLGSTRALTDNTGILTDRFDYDSYGQLARHNQTRFDQFESIQQVNQTTQQRLDKRAKRQAQREQTETEALLASATQLEDGTPSPFPRTQALTDAKTQIAQNRSTMKATSALSSSMLEAATAKTRHLFTGEQLDPNLGFYYLRARYMDPASGRFTQMDEWQGSPADPASLNKMAYANANPLTFMDPSGHFSLTEMMVGVSLVGISTSLSAGQAPQGIVETLGFSPYMRTLTFFKVASVGAKDVKARRAGKSYFVELNVTLGSYMGVVDDAEMSALVANIQSQWNRTMVSQSGRSYVLKANVSVGNWRDPGTVKVKHVGVGEGQQCRAHAYIETGWMALCKGGSNRNTGAHEFGHVLGFGDTYAEATMRPISGHGNDIMADSSGAGSVQWYHARVLHDVFK